MIVNKSMYPTPTGFGVISKMQDRFSTLQTQLGTGEKSSTLAGMGRDLPLSLSVRNRLNTIDGYSANIETVNLRLGFLDNAMSRLDKIEGEARNSATQGQYGTNNINMATLPGLSKARLDEVVTLLNSDVAGRYLFGGANTDTQPLPDTTSLLEGIGGKAGFKTVVGERKLADAGSAANGRLTVAQPASNAVSLTEDGNHPFGFKLLRVTSTAPGTAVSATTVGPSAAVTPPAIQTGDTTSITFAASPAEQIKPGQAITLGLQLPDGLDTQITLTAISAADAPAAEGQFIVGDDADANAASFQAALNLKLGSTVKTELAAASTFAASKMFFNGPGETAMRIAGNDPANAQGLRAATSEDTVEWYSGQTSAPGDNPRQSISAQVDDATKVNYGMQANESGLLRMVRTFASMSVETYPVGVESSRGLFDAMATRQTSEMSESHNSEPGSIEIMTMELGVATGTLKNATERHTNYKGQLENLLSDVETISKEEVAMEILSLQTRLEASYQVTSMVSKLSLVNYI